MFLMRILISYMYVNLFFCRYIWVYCPPPPPTKKLTTILIVSVRQTETNITNWKYFRHKGKRNVSLLKGKQIHEADELWIKQSSPRSGVRSRVRRCLRTDAVVG